MQESDPLVKNSQLKNVGKEQISETVYGLLCAARELSTTNDGDCEIFWENLSHVMDISEVFNLEWILKDKAEAEKRKKIYATRLAGLAVVDNK